MTDGVGCGVARCRRRARRHGLQCAAFSPDGPVPPAGVPDVARRLLGAGARAQQAAQRLQPRGAGRAGPARRHERVEAALRLVVRAAAGALAGAGGQVGERGEDAVGVDVRQPERPHAGGVDHPAAARAGGSTTADDDVCRPRPVTSLTTPVARAAPGTSALTSVDLPTPE